MREGIKRPGGLSGVAGKIRKRICHGRNGPHGLEGQGSMTGHDILQKLEILPVKGMLPFPAASSDKTLFIFIIHLIPKFSGILECNNPSLQIGR